MRTDLPSNGSSSCPIGSVSAWMSHVHRELLTLSPTPDPRVIPSQAMVTLIFLLLRLNSLGSHLHPLRLPNHTPIPSPDLLFKYPNHIQNTTTSNHFLVQNNCLLFGLLHTTSSLSDSCLCFLSRLDWVTESIQNPPKTPKISIKSNSLLASARSCLTLSHLIPL